MEQRDISYAELASLGDAFEFEVAIRGIKFPDDEIREQALLDFICQYQEGNLEPHVRLCCGATAEHSVNGMPCS